MPMSDYYMHLSTKRLGGLIVDITTKIPQSEWAAHGDGHSLQWRTPGINNGSIEYMELIGNNLNMNHYQDVISGNVYQVTAQQTTIQDVQTAQHGDMPVGPAWYGPQLQYAKPWRLRQWGSCNGTLWYWQSDWYPGEIHTNAAWHDPDHQTQSDCLRQTECWYWDDDRQWAIGTGAGRPFNADGTPLTVQVTYGQEAVWAPHIGLWTFRLLPTGSLTGAQNVWPW